MADRLNFQRLDTGKWGVKAQGSSPSGPQARPGDEVIVPKRRGGSVRLTLGRQATSWNGGRARVFEIASRAGVTASPRRRSSSDPRTMGARYAGRCKTCRGPIAVGDEITWSRSEGARHIDCAGVVDPAARQDEDAYFAQIARDDMEISRGVAQADHIRATRQLLGEDAAAAEELAWELRDPSY